VAVLPLRFLGDPVLRTPAEPVREFDRDLAALAADMVASMYAHGGVGLAAPQIGRSIRLFVADVGESRDGTEAIVLVNPEIVAAEGTIAGEEGCLSIPGVSAEVERHGRVRVRAVDPAGEPFEVDGRELLSRVLQHEIDHLNGVLFIDRLAPSLRQALLREYEALRDEARREAARRRDADRPPDAARGSDPAAAPVGDRAAAR
jgi:peptide deformylase